VNRWFGPKYIGFGVGPRSWQGWLATLVFGAGAILLGKWLPPEFGLFVTLVVFAVWLALFLVLVALTYRRDAPTRDQ